MTESRPKAHTEDTGARLRAIRELTGLSPREVARAAGLSTREVAAVERGRRRLSTDELRAVSLALKVRPEVLAYGAPMPTEVAPAAPPAAADPSPSPFVLPGDEPTDPATGVIERRRDFGTRKQIEESWAHLRAEMEGVIHQCVRVSTVGSGDDVLALLDSLETEIRRLRSDLAFQREMGRHERMIAAARGRRRATSESSANGAGR